MFLGRLFSRFVFIWKHKTNFRYMVVSLALISTTVALFALTASQESLPLSSFLGFGIFLPALGIALVASLQDTPFPVFIGVLMNKRYRADMNKFYNHWNSRKDKEYETMRAAGFSLKETLDWMFSFHHLYKFFDKDGGAMAVVCKNNGVSVEEFERFWDLGIQDVDFIATVVTSGIDEEMAKVIYSSGANCEDADLSLVA